MAGEFWLNDQAWDEVKKLLPKNRPRARGGGERRGMRGVIHVLRSGCRWKDCPAVYGPRTTIYNRWNRWSGRGLWMRLFQALVAAVPTDVAMIDSSAVKAQRISAGGGKGRRRNR